MAGHSKWANIKHKKGKQDKARGKKFTQLIREITVATQESGPEVESNPRLRLAIDKAQQANMPKDTIMRAIQRGSGEQDSGALSDVRYEGYAVGGVAVMVSCLTDNKNRTVGEVRHAFSKHGGNLGTDGSVAYMFDSKGELQIQSGLDYDQFLEHVLESGAEDIIDCDEGVYTIVASLMDFVQVRDYFMQNEIFKVQEASKIWSPNILVDINDIAAEKLATLIDVLEDLDDVQAVFSNASWPSA